MEFIKLYIMAAVTFLALDSVWLGVIAPKFYRRYIGHIMADKANFLAAALFYTVFIAGLVFFVIQPAFKDASLVSVMLRGALFGFVTYATFDLTNQAVLKNWPWLVTGVDLLWGAFITAAVSAAVVLIARAVIL